MENQNQLTPYQNQPTSLVQWSTQEVILRECKDKTNGVKHIAILLQRLGKLYQIPNWTEENAVMLAQWVYENYPYETFKSITECLYSPPKTKERNWRLTPDTIEEWMKIQIEKDAEKREKIHNKLKLEESKVAVLNLPDFDQLFKGTWFEQAKKEEQGYWDKVAEAKRELINKRNGNRDRNLQEEVISGTGANGTHEAQRLD